MPFAIRKTSATAVGTPATATMPAQLTGMRNGRSIWGPANRNATAAANTDGAPLEADSGAR